MSSKPGRCLEIFWGYTKELSCEPRTTGQPLSCDDRAMQGLKGGGGNASAAAGGGGGVQGQSTHP
jgi:hypothetical protein